MSEMVEIDNGVVLYTNSLVDDNDVLCSPKTLEWILEVLQDLKIAKSQIKSHQKQINDMYSVIKKLERESK